ncbi:MAG: hypothetical protein HBSIN02_13740 [Bacteroidia bacterium]|nr:MAG: hypothetical protein HBSIN02_13740 [Bacteroidia bacterium]
MDYGFSKEVNLSFDDTVAKATEELKKEGFGVLTTIDVKDTLKQKLGIDFKRYVILGACNPPFAHKALQAEEAVGLLLPCNIVVTEKGTGCVVMAFDPMAMTKLTENETLASIAGEVRERIQRVLDHL